MAAAWTHAVSSARKWGGSPEEFLELHKWFDHTKNHHGDFRHRALRHHTQGIAECVLRFGDSLTLTSGKVIPLRWVAEQHVTEDLGFLPSLSDWLKGIKPEPWMCRSRKLSQELEDADRAAEESRPQEG